MAPSDASWRVSGRLEIVCLQRVAARSAAGWKILVASNVEGQRAHHIPPRASQGHYGLIDLPRAVTNDSATLLQLKRCVEDHARTAGHAHLLHAFGIVGEMDGEGARTAHMVALSACESGVTDT